MDIRDLTAGSTLHLPVAVPGALFSVGDTHAAQGDGEVCGTAIESAMHVTLRFTLNKGAHLKTPRFSTPGPSRVTLIRRGITSLQASGRTSTPPRRTPRAP